MSIPWAGDPAVHVEAPDRDQAAAALALAELAGTDIADLNQALRRNINSARGYQPPMELTARRVRSTR
jgi:hypothetical protein